MRGGEPPYATGLYQSSKPTMELLINNLSPSNRDHITTLNAD